MISVMFERDIFFKQQNGSKIMIVYSTLMYDGRDFMAAFIASIIVYNKASNRLVSKNQREAEAA